MARRRSGATEFPFSSLRSDWYASNQALPLCSSPCDPRPPLCLHQVSARVDPGLRVVWTRLARLIRTAYVCTDLLRISTRSRSSCLFSGLERVNRSERRPRRHRWSIRSSRIFSISSTSRQDSTCSSWIATGRNSSLGWLSISKSRPLLLNGWQSYGRSSVLALEETAECVPASREIAAVLPCATTSSFYHSCLTAGRRVGSRNTATTSTKFIS